MSGVVKDPSGAVIPGASVILRDEASGTELKTVTDASGFYNIDPIPPKTYTLTVQMQGFSTFTERGIAVQPAARLELSITLKVGTQVQEVQVTASATQLMTTTSAAKTNVIGSTQMQNLSVVGRNAMELLTLLPGVVNSGFDPTNMGSNFGQGVNTFNINGLRTDQNDIRMDNAHMIDPGDNGGFIIEPNMDMIQEFSVKVSNFEADQGRSPLIIDTVGKSGGSALHGEAYYYGRNAVFNANDWSNNLAGLPRPASKFNYPGFNIGGPVRIPHSDFNKNHDKMFFFWAMEWQRQLPDPGTELATVPTQKMRGGDFTELLANCKNGRALNMPCQLQDPNTWGTNIASNILPPNLITNNGKVYLNTFPLPNFVDPKGRYNFAGRPLYPNNRNEQSGRIDYNLSDSTRLYVSLKRNADHQFYPYGLWSGENSGWTSNIPEPSPTIGINSGESFVINLVKVINPTLTNEFQFNTQALWLPNHYANPAKLSKSALGFNFKGMTFKQGAVPGFQNGLAYGGDFIPQITDGWDYFGGNPGAGRWGEGDVGNGIFADKTEFEWMDNLSKVHATHTLKFGVAIDRTRNDQNGGPTPEGMLITQNWGGMGTNNEFGDILTEHFKSFSQGLPDIDGLWRFWNWEGYAQDSWKATHRLTLNYGVRISFMQPWNEARRFSTTFDPRFYDPTQPTSFLNGLRTGRDFQVSKSVYPNPLPNFQPRLGFAYDVFGTGKTVLRAGFGMFVQRDQGNISFNMATAPPYAFSSSPSSPPNGFYTLSDMENLNPFGALGNLSIQAADPRDKNTPQVYEWSATLGQNIGLKTVMEFSYVGNVSRHLFNRYNLNAVAPGQMFKPGTNICCANNNDSTTADYVQYKPWGTINWSDHTQTANYHSLQVTARRNVSHGLTVLGSYTWSKTMGYASNFQGGTDPFDTRRNYAMLPYDRTHLLNFSYIYQLPSLGKKYMGGSRIARGVFDDWQISGVTHYSSGNPLRLGLGTITCNPSALCNSIGHFEVNGKTWYGTPDITLTPLILQNPQLGTNWKSVGDHWVNPTSFTIPPINTFGTFEQPTSRGPGSNNWDFTLFKSFPFGEGRRVEFRWAVFDFPNYSHPDNPQLSPQWSWNLPANATSFAQGTAVLTNANDFGVITNRHGHRQMEVALKIYF